MELVRLEGVTKTYHLGELDVPVLKGISLTIARGEMVALMGASGSGKTTLMNILGCLDRPSSGRYWLDGEEMSQLAPNQRALVRMGKLGFVFQSFNLLRRTSAIQNVVMPLDYSPRRGGRGESRQFGELLLKRVGLSDRTDHEPSQMSGGQQQRVAVARALINRPALVLADEPTGNLDSHTSVEILQMFQELNAEGITVVLVTHDPKVAAYAHRTIRVVDGLVVADETSESITHGEGIELTPHFGRTTVPAPGRTHGNGAALLPAVRTTAAPFAAGGEGSAVATATPGRTAAIANDDKSRRQPRPQPTAKRPHALFGQVELKRRSALPSLVPPTFRTAVGALRRNKMRSALTALGVVIGVAAVIAMTEIGNGSKTAIEKTIGSMGANNLMLFPGASTSGGVSSGAGTVQSLRPGDVVEMIRQCPAVSEAAPLVWCRAQVIYGNRNWIPYSMLGTTPAYFVVRDWLELEEGEFFTDSDVKSGSRVCLIGTTLKRELFEDGSPVGQEIRIKNVMFRVVGVLSSKGASMTGSDQDDIVVAPWTTIKYRVNASWSGSSQVLTAATSTNQVNTLNNLYPATATRYTVPSAIQIADTPQSLRLPSIDSILAKAADADLVPEAIAQMTGLLRERHRLPPERDDDFQIRDMTEIAKTLSATSALMGILLLVVATISLVVGGVGIMNIMLVSVTERTREIGLRMAVGARSYHILRQFLVEAMLLCLAGGAIGIVLGRGASMLVRTQLHWPTQVSPVAIVVSVLVSAGVGIVFGFYPAWKASRLDPIEALRYE